MNRISTTTQRTGRLQALSAAVLVAMTALTGAAWMNITSPDEATPVVTLDRVVIEGRRAEVQQLPRVVVTGRRDAAADGVQVASAR